MDHRNNAKFAFFYLLSLVSLIFMSIFSGVIVFQIINQTLIDSLNPTRLADAELLKFAISALIISAPVYYLTMRQINKNLKSGNLADSGIRRWLTYLILFVTAVVVIVWLIMTVNSFLNGDLTLKFILKDLTVFIIAGLIFSYYLYDIKREQIKAKDKTTLIFFLISLVLVISAFVSALFFVESPKETRARKSDQMILSDLQNLDSAIDNYFQYNGKVPESLDALIAEKSLGVREESLLDGDGVRYEYNKTSDDAYKICAIFETSNQEQGKELDTMYYIGNEWTHGTGQQCFEQIMIKRDKTDLPYRAPVVMP